MVGGTLQRDGGHESGEGNEHIHQVDGDHGQEYIESHQIPTPDALGCPRAVVIVVSDAHVAVWAMICATLNSNVALPAQSLTTYGLVAHWILLLLRVS